MGYPKAPWKKKNWLKKEELEKEIKKIIKQIFYE